VKYFRTSERVQQGKNYCVRMDVTINERGVMRQLLYCIVLYCIVLYCIVLYCIVLYCIVLYCIVLYEDGMGVKIKVRGGI